MKCERYKETSCYTFPLRINLKPFCEQVWTLLFLNSFFSPSQYWILNWPGFQLAYCRISAMALCCPMHCRMWGNIPGCYLMIAATSPSSPLVTKMYSDLVKCPCLLQEGELVKSLPAENSWFITVLLNFQSMDLFSVLFIKLSWKSFDMKFKSKIRSHLTLKEVTLNWHFAIWI